jgi:periplasmic protein TonB
MSSADPSPSFHPFSFAGGPADLQPLHRWALAMGVLLLHGALALAWSQWHERLPQAEEAAPIMVSMILPEAPTAIAPAPRPQPAPVTLPKPQAAPVLASATPQPAAFTAPPVPVPAPTPTPAVPRTEVPAPTMPVAAASPAAVDAPPVLTPPPPAAPLPPKSIQASAVRYLVPPQQVYPETSRRLGESGRVTLRVLVDEHGRAQDVQVTQSSGYSRLDQAAVSAMKQARFQPYLENGAARAVWAPATITYDLQD